jgi:hypothetical protein
VGELDQSGDLSYLRISFQTQTSQEAKSRQLPTLQRTPARRFVGPRDINPKFGFETHPPFAHFIPDRPMGDQLFRENLRPKASWRSRMPTSGVQLYKSILLLFHARQLPNNLSNLFRSRPSPSAPCWLTGLRLFGGAWSRRPTSGSTLVHTGTFGHTRRPGMVGRIYQVNSKVSSVLDK